MDKIVKCIAIDDEPLALEVLEKFCNRIEGIELNTYTDPEAGIEAIRQQQPDIVFLDIEMDKVSGMDIARLIRGQEDNGRQRSIIIFVTGYREYMEAAFDVNAFHYLVKPIDAEKFSEVFSRAWKEASVSCE